MLKIVWTNKCKSLRKKKRKNFDGRSKTSSAKSSSTHPNSYIIQHNTNAINITRTNAKIEIPKVAENNVSIMETKQGGEVTLILSKPRVKRKQVYIFSSTCLWLFHFTGALLALKFSICNDGTYASERSWKQQGKKQRMCGKKIFLFWQIHNGCNNKMKKRKHLHI